MEASSTPLLFKHIFDGTSTTVLNIHKHIAINMSTITSIEMSMIIEALILSSNYSDDVDNKRKECIDMIWKHLLNNVDINNDYYTVSQPVTAAISVISQYVDEQKSKQVQIYVSQLFVDLCSHIVQYIIKHVGISFDKCCLFDFAVIATFLLQTYDDGCNESNVVHKSESTSSNDDEHNDVNDIENNEDNSNEHNDINNNTTNNAFITLNTGGHINEPLISYTFVCDIIRHSMKIVENIVSHIYPLSYHVVTNFDHYVDKHFVNDPHLSRYYIIHNINPFSFAKQLHQQCLNELKVYYILFGILYKRMEYGREWFDKVMLPINLLPVMNDLSDDITDIYYFDHIYELGQVMLIRKDIMLNKDSINEAKEFLNSVMHTDNELYSKLLKEIDKYDDEEIWMYE